jgi:phosphonate transport system permease protein
MTSASPRPAATGKSPFADIDKARLEAAYPGAFRSDPVTRALVVGTTVALVGLFLFGLYRLEFSFSKMWLGIGRLGDFIIFMIPPDPGSWARFMLFLDAIAETLAIALLGTLGAALLGLPLGFLAAKNVIPNIFAHFTIRRGLDTIRSVDTLIWALVWINVVGLGPFAGVLAIISSDVGSFGKLFSEAIEASDKKPVEGIVSTGGSDLHAVRFGILPQVLPVMLSQVLYYFESNTRSSTIIGIVGAGGIGSVLSETIRTLEWQQVSCLLILVLITVALVDQLSVRLRFAIIGRRSVI